MGRKVPSGMSNFTDAYLLIGARTFDGDLCHEVLCVLQDLLHCVLDCQLVLLLGDAEGIPEEG